MVSHMPKHRGIIVCLCLVGTLATAAEFQFTREELEHPFGTDPGYMFYPDTAIDTEEVPNIVLKAEDSPDDPLHYYQLLPNTYFFYGNIAEVDENNRGLSGNAGFVVTSEGVVVIDALGTPKLGNRMIATIRTVTDKPITHLIITHNHPDHAYGAVAFAELGDVTTIAHAGQNKYLGSVVMDRSVAYRRAFIPGDMEGFRPIKAAIQLGDERFSKYTVKSGDRTFDIYSVGAHHSHGDLIVHQVEDGVVWISDLAFNNRVTFMADGDLEQAIEGQTWLLDSFADAKLMIPGHGSAQTPPFPMVTRTRGYMQRLRDMMTEAIENDVGLQAAIDQATFEDWKAVRLYDLNHGKNASFVYRALEMELF